MFVLYEPADELKHENSTRDFNTAAGDELAPGTNFSDFGFPIKLSGFNQTPAPPFCFKIAVALWITSQTVSTVYNGLRIHLV